MTNPRHPVYIISKTRHESMKTSRSLNRMRIPHYIAIEPQDWNNYEQALKNFDLDGNFLQEWNCTYIIRKEHDQWLISLATTNNKTSKSMK